MAGHDSKVKKAFCFKLDAMSVPEALATTILILLMFSIVLALARGANRRKDKSHKLALKGRVNDGVLYHRQDLL